MVYSLQSNCSSYITQEKARHQLHSATTKSTIQTGLRVRDSDHTSYHQLLRRTALAQNHVYSMAVVGTPFSFECVCFVKLWCRCGYDSVLLRLGVVNFVDVCYWTTSIRWLGSDDNSTSTNSTLTSFYAVNCKLHSFCLGCGWTSLRYLCFWLLTYTYHCLHIAFYSFFFFVQLCFVNELTLYMRVDGSL